MHHHGTPQETRKPCQDLIIGDIGGVFAKGTIGSGLYQFSKGIVGGPNGRRISNAFQQVRINSPRCGGSFSVWGGLYSSFDCTIVYFRQREDPWNSIMAGASAGGILALRQGPRVAGLSTPLGRCQLGLRYTLRMNCVQFANNTERGDNRSEVTRASKIMPMGCSSLMVVGVDSSFVLSPRTMGIDTSKDHISIELIGTDQLRLLTEFSVVLTNCNVADVEVWTHNTRDAVVTTL